MAIYRPRQRRWPVAVAAGLLGVLVGLLAGWALFDEEPDPLEGARVITAALASAAGTLEVVEIEYAESVTDGRVVQEAEYAGARDALERSAARFSEVERALEILDPERAAEARLLFDELRRLIGDLAPPADVAAAIDDLTAVLTP